MPTDPNTGGALVDLPTLDGGDVVRILKLSPRNVVRLTEELREARRKKLLSTLQAAGLAGVEMLKRLEAFDGMPIFVIDLVEAMRDVAWRYRAIELAVEQTGLDRSHASRPLDPDVSLEVALNLFGYTGQRKALRPLAAGESPLAEGDGPAPSPTTGGSPVASPPSSAP